MLEILLVFSCWYTEVGNIIMFNLGTSMNIGALGIAVLGSLNSTTEEKKKYMSRALLLLICSEG